MNKEMLKFLGIKNIEELFEDIPKEIRIDKLDLPPPKEDMEVEAEIRKILNKNKNFFDLPSFLPIIKPHYIPAIVEEITGRQEFYTSYTPYQAEASQGILQAMFEYQSIICELTGMDCANVSMYDSSTALGEAALMAHRINKKKKILIPKNIFWHKKSVLENYVKGAGLKIIEQEYGNDGRINLNIDEKDLSAIYIENPNFFGIIDDRYKEIYRIKEETDSILIVGVDPLYLAIFNPPSKYGADIVIGEGYFGNPMNFGGPLLGIFACKKEFIRQMPGKIVGLTKDIEGKRAFCLTMQTREQHIRRGKATSNICSNEALCCIAFLAYVAFYGRNGLRKLAIKNMENARYMANKLEKLGFKIPYKNFFNEFVAISPLNAFHLNKELLKKGIHGGLIINEFIENGILFGVTEMHKKEIIDFAIEKIMEIM